MRITKAEAISIPTLTELKEKHPDITFIQASEFYIQNSIHIATWEEYEQAWSIAGIKIVYCDIKIYNRENFFVSDQLLRENTESEAEYVFCKPWADEYNARIEKRFTDEEIDFSRPYTAFMAAQTDAGMCLIYQAEDSWMDESFISGEDALLVFLEQHEDDILSLKENDEEGLDLHDELRKKLLCDKRFRMSKNKDLRSSYTRTFFTEKENKGFLKLFKKEPTDYGKRLRALELVERLYDEYRLACSRNKIRLGESLPDDILARLLLDL